MDHKSQRFSRWQQSALSVPPVGMSDADLLARFANNRDEVAFELLVRRHAPMVLAVCRRLLVDSNDADDAFQATFLVLARKAGSVATGEVLGAWLHRVAFRVALRVRGGRTRRADREVGGVEELPSRPQSDLAWTELNRVLDEEVVQLPARHRAVFVLCCLEGKTGEEASRLLGCPPGTVSSRLTRARERIRDRLARRGFAPAIVLSSALSGGGLLAAPSAALMDSTLRAIPTFLAGWYPGGSSSRPAAIAEGVMRAMFLSKLRLVSLLCTLGLIAAGGVIAGSGGAVVDPEQPPAKGKVAEIEKALPGVPTVRLVQPRLGGRTPVILPAFVEASRQLDLHPRIAGVLKNVMVGIGDRVKTGQVLAEIDAPGLVLDERLATIAVEQAYSLLQDAEARLLIGKAEIEAAKGIVKLREAEVVGCRTNLESYKKLFDLAKAAGKSGSLRELLEDEVKYRTSEAQLVAASVSVDNAKLDLEIKRAKSAQCEVGIATAKANVDAARVGLEKARLLVSQTKVVAPFDGIAAQRNCRPGDFVDPAAMHPPVFTLMQTDIMRVAVSIPTLQLQTTKVGVPVEVNLPALGSGGRIAGKLARIEGVIDPKSDSIRGEIDIPNPKGDILPNMFATATFKFDEVLKIPVEAVIDTDPLGAKTLGRFVYVYRDGKAWRTRVTVGDIFGKEIEILSGLKAGDKVVTSVVTNPKHLVGDEIEVEVERPAPPK